MNFNSAVALRILTGSLFSRRAATSIAHALELTENGGQDSQAPPVSSSPSDRQVRRCIDALTCPFPSALILIHPPADDWVGVGQALRDPNGCGRRERGVYFLLEFRIPWRRFGYEPGQ